MGAKDTRPERGAGLRRGTRRQKVLAASSGGGHWVQLMRVIPALKDQDLVFATVDESYRGEVPGCRLHIVHDANRWDRLGSLRLGFQMLRVLVSERPDVVISTGAAIGFFAVLFGRLLRARTIWLDSVANVEQVSLSGRMSRPFADLWLTQWPHLAAEGGPEYAGRVF